MRCHSLRRGQRVALCATLVLVQSACHTVQDDFTAPPGQTDPTAKGLELTWRPTLKTRVRAARFAALDSSTRILNCLLSDSGFTRQVGRFPKFYGSHEEEQSNIFYTGTQIADVLTQSVPKNSTIVVGVPYGVTGSASTGIDQDGGKITLHWRHDGWKSNCPSNEAPAALLNTLMHEYMHLFPNTKGHQRFLDDEVGNWRHFAVSYQMGNLAQCYATHIEKKDAALDTAMDKCMSPRNFDQYGTISIATKHCLPVPPRCDGAGLAHR